MADEIIITGREAASVVVDTSGIPAIVVDFPVEQNLVADTVYVQGPPGVGGGGGAVSSVAGRTGDVILSSADLTDAESLATYSELTSGLAGKADTSHTHTITSLSAGSTDTTKVLAPDGAGGLQWVAAPTGGGVNGTTLTHPAIIVAPLRQNLSDSTATPVSLQPMGATPASVYGSSQTLTIFPVGVPVSVTYVSLSVQVLTAVAQTKRAFLWTKDAKGRPATQVFAMNFDMTTAGTVTIAQSGTIPAGDYWLGVEGFGAGRVQGWRLPAYVMPGPPSNGFTPFFNEGSGGIKTLEPISEGNLADMTTYTGRWMRDGGGSAGAPTIIAGVMIA